MADQARELGHRMRYEHRVDVGLHSADLQDPGAMVGGG
jgi:hypothetical protein